MTLPPFITNVTKNALEREGLQRSEDRPRTSTIIKGRLLDFLTINQSSNMKQLSLALATYRSNVVKI